MQLSFDFYYEHKFKDWSKKNKISSSLSYFIISMPEIILIIDTILKLITGFYENGHMITDKGKIIWHYLKHGLIYDVLAYMAVLIQFFFIDKIEQLPEFQQLILKSLQLFMYCKFTRINVMVQNVEQILVLKGEHDYALSLIKVCFKIVFIAHIFACAWHAIAYYADSETFTWLDLYQLRSESWDTR